MKLRIKIIALAVGLAAAATVLVGCASDADTVNQNISTDADQFKIQRQIVFYNSINDTYIATVTGKCSLNESTLSNAITVTCKIGADKYVKDYFRNADNVTWFALQTKPVSESTYNYKIIFKPAAIIPNLQIETGPHGGDDSTDGTVITTVPEGSPVAPKSPVTPKP